MRIALVKVRTMIALLVTSMLCAKVWFVNFTYNVYQKQTSKYLDENRKQSY